MIQLIWLYMLVISLEKNSCRRTNDTVPVKQHKIYKCSFRHKWLLTDTVMAVEAGNGTWRQRMRWCGRSSSRHKYLQWQLGLPVHCTSAVQSVVTVCSIQKLCKFTSRELNRKYFHRHVKNRSSPYIFNATFKRREKGKMITKDSSREDRLS